jgi:hypothetical protein
MNGAEQVQRFTATQRLERRLADLELVVDAQTALIVKQKETIDQDLQVFNERLRVYAEREAGRLDATDQILAAQIHAFIHQTFWQRLCWWLGF